MMPTNSFSKITSAFLVAFAALVALQLVRGEPLQCTPLIQTLSSDASNDRFIQVVGCSELGPIILNGPLINVSITIFNASMTNITLIGDLINSRIGIDTCNSTAEKRGTDLALFNHLGGTMTNTVVSIFRTTVTHTVTTSGFVAAIVNLFGPGGMRANSSLFISQCVVTVRSPYPTALYARNAYACVASSIAFVDSVVTATAATTSSSFTFDSSAFVNSTLSIIRSTVTSTGGPDARNIYFVSQAPVTGSTIHIRDSTLSASASNNAANVFFLGGCALSDGSSINVVNSTFTADSYNRKTTTFGFQDSSPIVTNSRVVVTDSTLSARSGGSFSYSFMFDGNSGMKGNSSVTVVRSGLSATSLDVGRTFYFGKSCFVINAGSGVSLMDSSIVATGGGASAFSFHFYDDALLSDSAFIKLVGMNVYVRSVSITATMLQLEGPFDRGALVIVESSVLYLQGDRWARIVEANDAGLISNVILNFTNVTATVVGVGRSSDAVIINTKSRIGQSVIILFQGGSYVLGRPWSEGATLFSGYIDGNSAQPGPQIHVLNCSVQISAANARLAAYWGNFTGAGGGFFVNRVTLTIVATTVGAFVASDEYLVGGTRIEAHNSVLIIESPLARVFTILMDGGATRYALSNVSVTLKPTSAAALMTPLFGRMGADTFLSLYLVYVKCEASSVGCGPFSKLVGVESAVIEMVAVKFMGSFNASEAWEEDSVGAACRITCAYWNDFSLASDAELSFNGTCDARLVSVGNDESTRACQSSTPTLSRTRTRSLQLVPIGTKTSTLVPPPVTTTTTTAATPTSAFVSTTLTPPPTSSRLPTATSSLAPPPRSTVASTPSTTSTPPLTTARPRVLQRTATKTVAASNDNTLDFVVSATTARATYVVTAATVVGALIATAVIGPEAAVVANDMQLVSLVVARPGCYQTKVTSTHARSFGVTPLEIGTSEARWLWGQAVLLVTFALLHAAVVRIVEIRVTASIDGRLTARQLAMSKTRWPSGTMSVSMMTATGFACELAIGLSRSESSPVVAIVGVIGAVASMVFAVVLQKKAFSPSSNAVINDRSSAAVLPTPREMQSPGPVVPPTSAVQSLHTAAAAVVFEPFAAAVKTSARGASRVPAALQWMLPIGFWTPRWGSRSYGAAFDIFRVGRTMFIYATLARVPVVAAIASYVPATTESCRVQSIALLVVNVGYGIASVALAPRRLPGLLPPHALGSIAVGLAFGLPEVAPSLSTDGLTILVAVCTVCVYVGAASSVALGWIDKQMKRFAQRQPQNAQSSPSQRPASAASGGPTTPMTGSFVSTPNASLHAPLLVVVSRNDDKNRNNSSNSSPSGREKNNPLSSSSA